MILSCYVRKVSDTSICTYDKLSVIFCSSHSEEAYRLLKCTSSQFLKKTFMTKYSR